MPRASNKDASAADRLFAAEVKRLRERRGLSMRALAEMAGVDPGQISRLEKLCGTPKEAALGRGVTFSTAVAIANVLAISIDRIRRKSE